VKILQHVRNTLFFIMTGQIVHMRSELGDINFALQ